MRQVIFALPPSPMVKSKRRRPSADLFDFRLRIRRCLLARANQRRIDQKTANLLHALSSAISKCCAIFQRIFKRSGCARRKILVPERLREIFSHRRNGLCFKGLRAFSESRRTVVLDSPWSSDSKQTSRSLTGTPPGGKPRGGAGAVPAGGICTPSPGGSGGYARPAL
jgi:hypothetical protein